MREFRVGRRWGLRAVCAAVLLGAGVLSCGTEEELPPPGDQVAPSRIDIVGGITAGATFSGQTTLEAVAEDESGQVAKVTFFVSGVPACTDATAKSSGSRFSCDWDSRNTPEGNHQLVATAQDAAGNLTSSTPMPFSVGVNVPPILSAVSANPTAVNEGQNVALSVTATDQAGDVLTYTWTQVTPASPLGTFTNENSATPTWKAPLLSTTTTFTLRVKVTDNRGGTSQRTVDLQVANVASANRAPTVDAAISAPGTVVAGKNADLSIGATDPDGDPLTYSWRTSPTANVGTFTGTSTAATGWRSPEISQDTSYTLQVTVSDGVASVTRSVSVRATVPRYSTDVQAIWNDKCTRCHSGTSPSGRLDLSASRSYSSLINGATNSTSCSTLRRVAATRPDSSLLIRKITGTSCGGRMPQDDTQYFANNPGLVTLIRSWILANALNN
ncbi:PKD domain-containing protein [Hyalangium gracile]|uniref:PKD domain-containing protein n=1 Tax=Hyalangium gracile TaxID=394092 RepID=UPI001CCB79EB|nr:Ig-like domain-containing protein [Hyalangium gracile]